MQGTLCTIFFIVVFTEVSIGFQSLQFLTTEGSSATVEICAQIDAGTLERSVSVYISTANQTATGIALTL